MRILLDECVPRRLGQALTGHDVHTVSQQNWSGKKNGELIALMEANAFVVLLTVDQGIQYQQNLVSAAVAVILMVAPTNQLADLLPLVPAAQTALQTIRAGGVVEAR